MKRETTILVLVMALVLGNMYGQVDKMKDKASKKGTDKMAMELKDMEVGAEKEIDMDMGVDVKNWPEASKMAVTKTTEAYGKPTGITEEELVWSEAGPWKTIRISKEETKHSFPLEHTDMLQMTVMYNVPEDKMDELGQTLTDFALWLSTIPTYGEPHFPFHFRTIYKRASYISSNIPSRFHFLK